MLVNETVEYFTFYYSKKQKSPTNIFYLWGICNLNHQWSRNLDFIDKI